MLTTEDLIARHPDAWRDATRHPFLDAVRDGSLPPAAFRTWLAQDYLFVSDLLVFQSRLLARTPRPDQAVIAGGLVALESELTWFEAHAAGQQLELTTQRHPTTERYRAFLREARGITYEAAVTALWAIERAYLEAWQSAAPGAGHYVEFVRHWTVPEFSGYVAGLARAADAALKIGKAAAAEQAFLEVASLERDFWQMTWEAPEAPEAPASVEEPAPQP